MNMNMNVDFSKFVGKVLDSEVPQQEILNHAGRTLARVCKPDAMMTRDFNPTRVNIFVDDKNVITMVTIG